MMAEKHSVFRKGAALSLALVIALVMVITLATGWVGLHQAEKLTEFHHWVTQTGRFWLVWRLCLYAVLGWGGQKIWQRTKQQPEYRAVLIRMMVASLLFILLGEYVLSGHVEGIR
ncbi:putative exported protein [Xenorhabdus bovienii str. oregonense]|uniref:Putative exported protein n=1 Tax=Xenorhabdus bovienii str. oregonense TaxID=1398202 RepID=A0A077NRW2_XENBV|nr:hypothetical protein [Xenorhabdus bovienii]CDH04837.1 putative exported protein [Xenorhabdus bovienii str. oregonense]